MTDRKTYRNIQEIKAANKAINHYFFDKDVLEDFSSIIYSTVYYGCLFITSEQHVDRGIIKSPRYYNVRECVNGRIDTIGPHYKNTCMKEALGVLEAYAQEKGYTNE